MLLCQIYHRLDVCGNADDDNDNSTFDRIRGEDSWLGRRVLKKFWVGKGKSRHQVLFAGQVTDIDEDEHNPGHRLFEVKYEDGDVEWADAVDISTILTPLTSAQVASNNAISILFVFSFNILYVDRMKSQSKALVRQKRPLQQHLLNRYLALAYCTHILIQHLAWC